MVSTTEKYFVGHLCKNKEQQVVNDDVDKSDKKEEMDKRDSNMETGWKKCRAFTKFDGGVNDS